MRSEAYTRRMKGEDRSFKERERVICPECGKEIAKGSLVTHRQTQNGVEKWGFGSEGNEADGGNNHKTYRMVFPAKSGTRT